MKSHLYITLLLALSFMLSACYKEEEGDSLTLYADIQGVVSQNDLPVQGAEIHIKNQFSPGGFEKGNSIGIGITIPVNANITGNYELNLYRFGTEEVFLTLLDEELEPGTHNILAPDSMLTNGTYIFVLEMPFNQTYQSSFLINKPDSTLPGTLPLATTNANGAFDLEADFLAIGQSFRNGNYLFDITDSLQIIVVLGDSIITREYIKVGKSSNFVDINID